VYQTGKLIHEKRRGGDERVPNSEVDTRKGERSQEEASCAHGELIFE